MNRRSLVRLVVLPLDAQVESRDSGEQDDDEKETALVFKGT